MILVQGYLSPGAAKERKYFTFSQRVLGAQGFEFVVLRL